MNIGIDLDDTILNTHKVLIKFICDHYNLNYKYYKTKKYQYFKNNFEDYYKVAKNNYNNLIKKVKVKYGVKKYLNKLKKDGHKIIFISSRDYLEFEDPYIPTIEYLKNKKIPYDKLILNAKNKKQVCLEEKIDIFFDDSIMHCNSVASLNTTVYLMDHYTNKEEKHLKRIYDVRGIYKMVKRKEKLNGRKHTY